jgi:phosphoenolpyruvate carboxykinase (GTP)
VRFDPFAMLPFCGYHMGDYFAHWLSIGEQTSADKLPKLFWVNWFRKGDDGKFLWPGFGDNARVLKWVVERVDGEGDAVDTAIGRVPTTGAIDTSGLDLPASTLAQLVNVDEQDWRDELPLIEEHYDKFGDRLPQALKDELANLEKRLTES